MIALAVLTDGRRDYVEQTIRSAKQNLVGPVTTKIIWDDSGDVDYHVWLSRYLHDGFTIVDGHGRSGFGGAVRQLWNWLSAHTTEPFILGLEDDFTFNHPVRLTDMAAVLVKHPYLAQMALRRQPWNDVERAAGGVVEMHPEEYEECGTRDGCRWLEHRLFWTTNQCLFRREVLAEGWPRGGQSERQFTHRLVSEGFDGIPASDVKFGYWGSRDSGEAIHHIGDERVGCGY